MHAPPDVKMRRAALPGSPNRNINPTEYTENTKTTATAQARSLRQRFALAHYVAVSLAPLVWGLPR